MSSEHVEVLREMKGWRMPPIGGSAYNAALDAAIASLSAPQPPADTTVCTGDEIRCHDGHGCECAMRGQPPAEAQPVALDYAPGELDRTAPESIWLQIDTSSDNNGRRDPWPGADGVTWQDESVGGLEIQYVRADLVSPPSAPVGVEIRKAKDVSPHSDVVLVADLSQQPAAVDGAIRRDAERYRWLAENRCDVTMCASATDYGDGDTAYGPRVEVDPDQFGAEYGSPKAKLDAAIDAAREARNG